MKLNDPLASSADQTQAVTFQKWTRTSNAFESLQFEAAVSWFDLELMKVKIKGETVASLLFHGVNFQDALQLLLKKL